MRILAFFCVISIVLYSCNYFESKKTTSETILNEELKTFNWHAVDEYPSFKECYIHHSKVDRKQCFESVLITHINNYMASKQLIVSQDITDTLYITFTISETGNLDIINFTVDSLTRIEIPKIEQYIDSALISLPKIQPAIKRGQQVKTEFNLPIILNVN